MAFEFQYLPFPLSNMAICMLLRLPQELEKNKSYWENIFYRVGLWLFYLFIYLFIYLLLLLLFYYYFSYGTQLSVICTGVSMCPDAAFQVTHPTQAPHNGSIHI